MNTLKISTRKHKVSGNRGFTLIEMIVSLSIFAIMTALVLSKYGTFNQGVLITNLAYDTAIAIRSAQSAALNVKDTGSAVGAVGNSNFSNAYGIHFDTTSAAKAMTFIYFANSASASDINVLDPSFGVAKSFVATGVGASQTISTYTMKSGNTIANLCTNIDTTTCPDPAITITKLDVVFKRPYPDAIITATDSTGGISTPTSAEIVVKSATGISKKIIVRSTGQIQISN